mmetsp:Transcript_10911/g.28216  ORF Transcript_10911/g.28216 Transcript_10911/m.28216 type:complete len:269 (+) Transcript_10911:172-978(+)
MREARASAAHLRAAEHSKTQTQNAPNLRRCLRGPPWNCGASPSSELDVAGWLRAPSRQACGDLYGLPSVGVSHQHRLKSVPRRSEPRLQASSRYDFGELPLREQPRPLDRIGPFLVPSREVHCSGCLVALGYPVPRLVEGVEVGHHQFVLDLRRHTFDFGRNALSLDDHSRLLCKKHAAGLCLGASCAVGQPRWVGVRLPVPRRRPGHGEPAHSSEKHCCNCRPLEQQARGVVDRIRVALRPALPLRSLRSLVPRRRLVTVHLGPELR